MGDNVAVVGDVDDDLACHGCLQLDYSCCYCFRQIHHQASAHYALSCIEDRHAAVNCAVGRVDCCVVAWIANWMGMGGGWHWVRTRLVVAVVFGSAVATGGFEPRQGWAGGGAERSACEIKRRRGKRAEKVIIS